MTKVIRKIHKGALSVAHNRGRQCFSVGVTLVIVFAGLYVYFVAGTVANILSRKSTELEIKQTASHISDLEETYLAKNQSIDIAFAKDHGFSETNNVLFVTRPSIVGLNDTSPHAF